jgi:hypothetical protein
MTVLYGQAKGIGEEEEIREIDEAIPPSSQTART